MDRIIMNESMFPFIVLELHLFEDVRNLVET